VQVGDGGELGQGVALGLLLHCLAFFEPVLMWVTTLMMVEAGWSPEKK
jgi:hypothetical protein